MKSGFHGLCKSYCFYYFYIRRKDFLPSLFLYFYEVTVDQCLLSYSYISLSFDKSAALKATLNLCLHFKH